MNTGHQFAESPFDPGAFYSPDDVVSKGFAAKQTLAKWRHEKRGPAYVKSGSRILYSGKDLLNWLEANRVEPKAA